MSDVDPSPDQLKQPSDPQRTAPEPADSESDDPMGPPKDPCECWCMHCRRTFMSSEMWLQRVIGDPSGFPGYWMCPTPNCSGAGFTMDIFPTDPDHPANGGWHYDDDEECDEDEEYDPEADDFDDDDDDDVATSAEGSEHSVGGRDPNETKWKELDEELGDEDDDIEGEEWKHGLQPGERPPEPDWMEQARRRQEEEERKYDEPDRRPREVDWTPREGDGGDVPGETRPWTEDDIPF